MTNHTKKTVKVTGTRYTHTPFLHTDLYRKVRRTQYAPIHINVWANVDNTEVHTAV